MPHKHHAAPIWNKTLADLEKAEVYQLVGQTVAGEGPERLQEVVSRLGGALNLVQTLIGSLNSKQQAAEEYAELDEDEEEDAEEYDEEPAQQELVAPRATRAASAPVKRRRGRPAKHQPQVNGKARAGGKSSPTKKTSSRPVPRFSGSLRERIVQTLQSAGPMKIDEISQAMGEPVGRIRAVVNSSAKSKGEIISDGVRGPGGATYRAAK